MVPADFNRIRIEPAYRQVAAALTDHILAKQLRDGERLPSELALARQFGVNRSTVREALRELESLGLLARRPGGKQLVVTRPEADIVGESVSRALVMHDVTFEQVWEALALLEPPIAQIAARARLREDVRILVRIAAAFGAESASTTAAVGLVGEFFGCLGTATRNPALRMAQEPLVQLIETSLGGMIDEVPQARARIARAQQELCAAVNARDGGAAHTWMARHIRDFRRGYEIAGLELTSLVGVRDSRPKSPRARTSDRAR